MYRYVLILIYVLIVCKICINFKQIRIFNPEEVTWRTPSPQTGNSLVTQTGIK